MKKSSNKISNKERAKRVMEFLEEVSKNKTDIRFTCKEQLKDKGILSFKNK